MGRIPIIVVLALLGVALVATGLLVGSATFGIEGAYFTRAAGTPAYSEVFTRWGSGAELGSPHDGNLWLGAGIVVLLLAGAGIALRVRGRAAFSIRATLAAGALLLAAGIAIGPPGVTMVLPPRNDGYETNAGLLNPDDGNLWIGAGIACAVAGLTLWIARLLASARSSPQRA